MCGEEHAEALASVATSSRVHTRKNLLDDLVVVRPILKRWGTAPDQRPPSRCQRLPAEADNRNCVE